MIQPSKNPINLEKAKIKERKQNEERIMDLKEKVRILVESPLFINGDFLDNDLFIQPSAEVSGAKIIHFLKKQ